MDVGTRNLVRQRAGQRCEYCRITEAAYRLSFHVEHIVASVHKRNDAPSNLAWACPRCNAHKGPNLTTIDPKADEQVNLFNPRTDVWEEHFLVANCVITGLTAVGRGTVSLLQMNEIRRVELRRAFSS